MIDVLYFAWVRERVGLDSERMPLPDGVQSVAGLLDHLMTLSEAHVSGLAERDRLRFAVNQQFARIDATIQDGDEIAIFPPVTGG